MIALFAAILAVATVSTAQAQQVNIDVDFNTKQVTVTADGMEVRFGERTYYRKNVDMRNGRIAIGSNVITRTGAHGKVVAMNPTTRMITVYVNFVNQNFKLSDLGVTSGCNRVFCVDENVVLDRGAGIQHGQVRGFFADGTVAVYAGFITQLVKPYEIGLTDVCSDLFCTGDNVVLDNGQHGKISGIFADGSYSVYANYVEQRLAERRLSMTSAICGNIYINRVEYCR